MIEIKSVEVAKCALCEQLGGPRGLSLEAETNCGLYVFLCMPCGGSNLIRDGRVLLLGEDFDENELIEIQDEVLAAWFEKTKHE